MKGQNLVSGDRNTMLYIKSMRLRKYGPPFIICEARLRSALTPPGHSRRMIDVRRIDRFFMKPAEGGHRAPASEY